MVRAWLRGGGPLQPYRSDAPALFADAFRSGQEQGDIPPDVDASRAGFVVFDAYMGVLYRWVGDDDGRLSLEEGLMASLDLVFAGIAREAATERPT
jgi:hypothetical protein